MKHSKETPIPWPPRGVDPIEWQNAWSAARDAARALRENRAKAMEEESVQSVGLRSPGKQRRKNP